MTSIFHTHEAKPKRRPKLKAIPGTLAKFPLRTQQEWDLLAMEIGRATAPAKDAHRVTRVRERSNVSSSLASAHPHPRLGSGTAGKP